MTRKTVLSYSGGLDSTVLLYHLLDQGDQVFCLNFTYGARHNEEERACARAQCEKLNVPFVDIDLPFISKLYKSSLLKGGSDLPTGDYDAENMRQTVVPGRNTILMSIAIGFAESHEAQRIAIANHADDHGTYPDTRPEWVSAMALTAWHGTYQRVGLYAPFTHMSKAEICQTGHRLGVPFAETWTCYAGGAHHCGDCSSCHSRKEAFQAAGLSDPTRYG